MIEYDIEKHITAAEMRNQGIPIPEPIPGAAFVPRGSYRTAKVKGHVEEQPDNGPKGPKSARKSKELPPKRKLVTKKLSIAFREPFRLEGKIFLVDAEGNIRIEKEEPCDSDQA